MSISVNWATKIVTIPQADLTLISGTIYEADTDDVRLELKALESSEEGMPYLDITQHNTEVSVAGVTYARTIEIINGYTIQFEDGQYTVILKGSNNNIFDVESGILVQNQVQVIPTNAAGLIVKSIGSGLSTEEHDKLMALVNGLTAAQAVLLDEIHKIKGLDVSNPMTVTLTSREAGSVKQTISGNGETTSTVQRT